MKSIITGCYNLSVPLNKESKNSQFMFIRDKVFVFRLSRKNS